MKETLLLGVVAFLVATGGGTWFAAYLSPPRSDRSAPSGRVAAVTGGGKPDAGKRKPDAASAKPSAASSEASKPSAAPSQTSPKTESGTPAQPGQARAVEDTVAPASLSPAKDPKAAKDLGKILVSMKPVQAAKILEKLTDDDIEAIIRQLNPKQVAPLFVALPSERAVSMSRRLLLHATKKEGRSE